MQKDNYLTHRETVAPPFSETVLVHGRKRSHPEKRKPSPSRLNLFDKFRVTATNMASAFASMPPSLFLSGSKISSRNLRKLPASTVKGRQRCAPVVSKALGDGSDSSSQSIVKYVQNSWNKSEDRIGLVGLGFAAIVAVWASSKLIVAIDKLPLIPSALELIGILFSWWFIYRYLLFKPDREELLRNIKNSISDILGQ